MPGSDLVQSVLRACDLLEHLAGSDGIRLQEFSEATGLKPPTVHNLLRTLAARGYANQDDSGRWRLGDTPRSLADRDHDRDLLVKARSVLLGIADDIPNSILNLAEVVENHVVVQMRASPDRPQAIQQPRRQVLPPYGSAGGLACLAFSDHSTATRIREAHPFEEGGSALWRDRASLDAYLQRSRAAGSITTPFPNQELIRVAAPVYGAGGQFRATLGAALPARTCSDDDLERLRERVCIAAEKLSEDPT
ncbi:MAG: helix-turn-helix domain-containing protein [Planctomycetota bacterium]|jgi:IclR family acetate operon transcriptional repressor|nr:helix-turn-helix domain-containing protein [Planctomycetota bacterium]